MEVESPPETLRAEGGLPLLLEGEAGQIAPGLRFLRTPGHSPGSICLLAETSEGLLVIAGDTVGPLPEYFETMDLPHDLPGWDELLVAWRRIRDLHPRVIIPGHNPPMILGAGGEVVEGDVAALGER